MKYRILLVVPAYMVFLVVVLFATQAFSQDYQGMPVDDDWKPEQLTYFEKHEDDPVGSLGSVLHYNMKVFGLGEETVEVDTDYGIFIFVVDNTHNGECKCEPDTVEFMSGPEGYTVVPFMLTTDEGSAKRMYIYPILGS